MKIDDIANSNDTPIDKAKQAVALWNETEEWMDKQNKEVQEKYSERMCHTLDITGILCSNISDQELKEIMEV